MLLLPITALAIWVWLFVTSFRQMITVDDESLTLKMRLSTEKHRWSSLREVTLIKRASYGAGSKLSLFVESKTGRFCIDIDLISDFTCLREEIEKKTGSRLRYVNRMWW